MKNVNYVSHFSRLLDRQGFLKHNPLQVVDAGARGGPQSHWGVYGQSVNVIGFEPYEEESDRLNREAKEGKLAVPFTCFPVALGNKDSNARLYEYPHNKASNSLTPPQQGELTYRDISVRRFDSFAREHGVKTVDFMKIDVERHEVEVIEGLGKFLGAGEILGFEIEVLFWPKDDAPLMSDIDILLRRLGYNLYDVDVFRFASMALPSPVAWDHRDHNDQAILGPTLSGRLAHGDALFFKDIASEKETILRNGDATRILKMASLFELYGLPDCAADLLEEYRTLIDPIVPVDALLNAFVPNHYGEGLTYKQYLQAYALHVGRVPEKNKEGLTHLRT
jgi:FkbM family methyltransferase